MKVYSEHFNLITSNKSEISNKQHDKITSIQSNITNAQGGNEEKFYYIYNPKTGLIGINARRHKTDLFIEKLTTVYYSHLPIGNVNLC